MRGILKIFLVLIGRYPKLAVWTTTLLIISGLFQGMSISLVLPLLATLGGQKSSDTVLEKWLYSGFEWLSIPMQLVPVLIVLVVLVTLSAGAKFLSIVQIGYAGWQVQRDFREQIIDSTFRAEWRYSSQLSPGGLTTALGTEAMHASATYVVSSKIVAGIWQLGVFLTISSLVSIPVTLAAILFGGALAWVFLNLMKETQTVSQARKDAMENLSARTVEGMSSLKALKAMGEEVWVIRTIGAQIEVVRKTQRRLSLLAEALTSSPEPVLALMVAVGIYLFVVQFGGAMNSVLVLALLFIRATTEIRRLQRGVQSMLRHEPSFWFLENTVQGARRSVENLTGSIPPRFDNAIELRGVEVTYQNGGPPALSDVSLTIPPSGFFSITGPTGAGKSTLVNIIAGLEYPSAGEIRVDGTAMQDLDIVKWRRMIGYVPQEIFLFPQSIAQNTSLDDPEVNRDDIKQALCDAGAWEFVSKLPDGMDSEVGQGGNKLSGGERQRIAIAHALVRRPKLLILDEATAGLDQETEQGILSTLKKLSGGITILAISHNPTIMNGADQCIHIEEGRVWFDAIPETVAGE